MTTLMLLDPCLGNLGSAKTQCIHTELSIDHSPHVTCSSGIISQIVYFGLTPFEEHHDEEELRMKNDFCGDPASYAHINQCSNNYIDGQKLKQDFEASCIGH